MTEIQCKACPEVLPPRKKRKTAFVMFIGLSAKPGTEPLCSSTNSGKLIHEIEQHVTEAFSVYKTNLVKCAPTDSSGKLRYPTTQEMRNCLPRLLAEINHYKPRAIVLLGGHVAKFLFTEVLTNPGFDGFADDFDYEQFSFNGSLVLPIHHPSYIWIYRRKRVHQYITAVSDRLLEVAG